MTVKTALLAAACTLALAACNRTPNETPEPAAPAAETTPATAPATTPPPAETAPAPAPTPAPAAGEAKPAATVADCATTIEGNDAIQYNVGSIAVPASCSKFTINLKHVGTLPVAAMGHNVVISKDTDMAGVVADGASAGAAADFVKAGDARVVAHTKLIGGGETTSVSFDTAKIKDGAYMFFCSFPGHSVTMKGTIAVQ